MANTNTNANTNATHKIDDELKSQERVYTHLIESRKRTCNHRASNKGQIIPVHRSKVNISGKDELPESTVICTRCNRYFERDSFKAEEIESALYMLTSMAEQVKLVSNLTEEDKVTLEEYYNSLDRIRGFETYYLNMIEKIGDGNGNSNKPKTKYSKGHIGLNSNMFNGRGY